MPLHWRLFLGLGAFMALLLLAQFALVQTLSRDLETQVARFAYGFGTRLTEALDPDARLILRDAEGAGVETGLETLEELDLEALLPPPEPGEERQIVVRRIEAQGPLGGRSDQGDTSGRRETSGLGRPGDPSVVGRTVRVFTLETTDGDAQVMLPDAGIDRRLGAFRRQLLLGSLGLSLLGLVAAGWVALRIARPLAALADAATAVGEGNLGVEVDAARVGPEVRRAIGAFNRMSHRLAALEASSRAHTQRRHLAEIGELSRAVAHTLRNPLNALGLAVDGLADAAGQPSLAATARRQIRRLDERLRTFLTLASQGGEVGSVALEPLLRDVALEALQSAAGRVSVVCEIDQGPGSSRSAELPGIEAELRSIVQALVVNAVEASPEGGRVVLHLEPLGETPESELSQSSIAGPARWRIRVEDRGAGVASAVRARLFEPHVTTKEHGSGMGLFLAQRLAAHRYEGRLDLLDRAGGGTTARLDLGPRSTDRAEAGALS